MSSYSFVYLARKWINWAEYIASDYYTYGLIFYPIREVRLMFQVLKSRNNQRVLESDDEQTD